MKLASGRFKTREKRLSHITYLTTGCGGVKILHETKKQLHKSRQGAAAGNALVTTKGKDHIPAQKACEWQVAEDWKNILKKYFWVC